MLSAGHFPTARAQLTRLQVQLGVRSSGVDRAGDGSQLREGPGPSRECEWEWGGEQPSRGGAEDGEDFWS